MAFSVGLFPKYFPLPCHVVQDRRGRRNIAAGASSTGTADSRERRPQNVEGEFFVDRRCIDCDACRWLAPETFTRVDEQSAVFKQPSCQEERLKALQALLCCPTSSIHTQMPTREILEVQKMFPLPIDQQRIPGVYYCGYHSERSYGATSYLIVHPEGNILVDSPRYSERLAHQIQGLGGARYMFLTHKDDVADHKMWSRRLRCERIMHSADVEASTAEVEMKLYGDGPWSIGKDFEVIYTPGHSEGSVCLFYKSLKVLFTGDHLAKSEDSELNIGEQYNHHSVHAQLDNVRKLLDFEFLWILPGHWRRVQYNDVDEKNSAIHAFLSHKGLQYTTPP